MKFKSIVFLQGSEASESLDTLNDEGVEAAMTHLQQWESENPPKDEVHHAPLAGYGDDLFREGRYIMSWNFKREYIGLEKIVEE